jgi:hypothetical protein
MLEVIEVQVPQIDRRIRLIQNLMSGDVLGHGVVDGVRYFADARWTMPRLPISIANGVVRGHRSIVCKGSQF